MGHFLIINGPNLNLLGRRDSATYGKITLDGLKKALQARAKVLKATVDFYQSNSEANLINFLQNKSADASGVIVNPASLSKVGYPLLDALIDAKLPFVEVHLSNIAARESFRRESIFSRYAVGGVSGLGARGYLYALQFLVERNEDLG